MLILSTFNSDYLQSPLQFLLEKFTPEPINIKYVNKNLIGELLNLNSNLEEPKSYAILFRIFDFIEPDTKVDETKKLMEHLDLIIKQIIGLKRKKGLPLLVFLCPNSSEFYNNNNSLEEIEKKFIKSLSENKIHTLTLSNIKERYGDIEFKNPIEDDTHIPYTPECYTAIACLLARKLHSIIQKPYKVIAVDCDNTLWTGAAADDGAENIVFKEHNILLQKYLVGQQEKGIIICLCSKNNEETALDVFKKRQSEMPLKLDHISKYKINWREKSENIKELSLELNLFPDSFRFIDDNPIEINNVSQISGVLCITMPGNLDEFRNNWIFDTDEHSVITDTDEKRSKFYKQAEIKTALATQFLDPIEYLRSSELGQSIVISKIEFEEIEVIERVSQLSGKTNQFNLFPEAKGKEISEINEMIESDKKEVFVGRIKDKFSPEDITAISMCSIERNAITIDNFFVSCRSFGRGIEFEMLKHIARIAQEKDIIDIKIKFKKSQKNKAASIFLNILSEQTNKDPTSRFLFKKVNLCLDFNLLELDEESTLTLSVRKLIDLELDSLIRASLNVPHRSAKLRPNKLITDNNDIGEKYLIELQKMTSSLEYLLNNFFIDNDAIKAISESDNSINEICINLLGEEGQDKSLVARGLDSLKATELRSYIFKISGIEIPLLIFRSEKTTVSSLNEYIKKPKVVSEEEEKIAQNNDLYNQPRPASFQQERMWLAEQQEIPTNSANFHMFACYKVSKKIDVKRFELACKITMQLYDAFGTSFNLKDGKLKQFVLKPEERELNFQLEELGGRTLEEAIQSKISEPWTMQSEAPLIRFVIFEDNNYHIFIHVHHAIFDANSLKNCLEGLSKLYEHSLKSTPEFNDPPQYLKFINHQQKKLADEAYQSTAYNFWKDRLSKIKTATTLPSDLTVLSFKPATEQTANRYTFSLSAEDLSNLKALVKVNRVTCFTAVNALFGLLISAYTFQKNITLITATNGRGGHYSYDKMVGFFVNLLIQQFDLDKTLPFTEYLKQVNKKFLGSQEFQDISFGKIQEILYAQGIKDILLSPALIYQSYVIPELRLDNEIAELEMPEHPIIFDMRTTCRFGHFTLFAQENQQELNFVIEYAQDLFSLSFIDAFAKNFSHTIKNICSNSNQKLQDISVVCDEERKQLISLGQGPKLDFAENDNLVSKFQQIVAKYPDNNALCYGEERLSYKIVDQQATNLAYALVAAGVKQGNYIGIFLEANHLFFIAELAALKIGAVFIPLSKENPNERLKLIINDANIQFLIVDDSTKDLFYTDFQACQLISIKSIECVNLHKALPPLVKTMVDVFCILYTSGSTGKPKGVILPEKGILRVVESPKFLKVLPGDKIAQTANQAFDAAQLECWLAWNNGACLVLFDKETLLNTSSLQSKLAVEKITHMWLTAGLFNIHANIQSDLFNNLKYLIVGGDVVYKDTISKILKFEKSPIIINGYGPTETSIFALAYIFNKQTINNFDTSPIGTPINNTTIQILTSLGTLAPIGAIGELSIGGDGVACYLNLPELEKERFIGSPEQREFLTGDLVRYDKKNKVIMFGGRANKQQVKINGYLVSPEEVRICLSRHPAIKQVELLITKIDGTNQLVAFYIMNSREKLIKSANHEFNHHLSESFPEYMFPVIYTQLDDFPINANGKLDEIKLQNYELKLNANNLEEILPKTKNGIEILKIVQNILTGFPNNIIYSFISFGCNSLKAMLIINAINNKFRPNFKKEFKEKFALEFENEYEDKLKEKFERYFSEKKFYTNDVYAKPTIKGLEELLIKKLNNETKNKSLRALKPGDSNLPAIVFIHPAGGGISIFDPLIKHITCNNPCYGIEDPLLGIEFKELSMEEMSRKYVDMIQNEVQGFFILAGYSFGGMLALEMAAQYESKSESQHLLEVVLFDTWVVAHAPDKIKSELKKDVLIYCEKQREKINMADLDGDSPTILASLKELCEYHQEIGFKFKPQKLVSTPICLFKANIHDDKFAKMNSENENNYLSNYPSETLFKKYEIEATHYNLLKHSNENYLAKYFSDHIEEFNQKKLPERCSTIRKAGQFMLFNHPLTEINNSQFPFEKNRFK